MEQKCTWGDANNRIYSYSLSTPWVINTSVWDGSASNFSIAAQDAIPRGVFFNSDGTKMYLLGDTNDRVYSYSLSTAWMINTSTWDGSASNLSVAAQDNAVLGLFFKTDGTKMYVSGNNISDQVHSYTLAAEAPMWSSNSTNSTLAGTWINHTVVWTDGWINKFHI